MRGTGRAQQTVTPPLAREAAPTPIIMAWGPRARNSNGNEATGHSATAPSAPVCSCLRREAQNDIELGGQLADLGVGNRVKSTVTDSRAFLSRILR